jgi:RNA polymerase sigma factor (sigma-70 family)
MLEPPNEIVLGFEKPGPNWSEDERDWVITWLNIEPQLTELRALALRHLGTPANWQDAEDTWNDFALRNLDRVIACFDPTQATGGFRGYLLISFKRYCWERGKKIRNRPQSLPDAVLAELDEVQFVGADDCLQACLNRLPQEYREVVTLCYFDGYSMEEISQKLGISVALAKVRLFRARQMLKKCLVEKGIRP